MYKMPRNFLIYYIKSFHTYTDFLCVAYYYRFPLFLLLNSAILHFFLFYKKKTIQIYNSLFNGIYYLKDCDDVLQVNCLKSVTIFTFSHFVFLKFSKPVNIIIAKSRNKFDRKIDNTNVDKL